VAVSFEEYLRRGAQDPALRGQETQQLRNALQAISSYQRNIDVGSSLGIESTGKPEGGVLRRFMETLERPALGLRAGALKAVGYNDPRLNRYANPFEAAGAGLRGEVRITGGDIFRTQRTDNPLERAAKLGAAFTFDVGTDPITYVGTPAALGRKTATELAFREGSKSLDEAIRATAVATNRNADEVGNELIERIFNMSDQGTQLRIKDPEMVKYVQQIREEAAQKARENLPSASSLNPAVVAKRAADDAENLWRSEVASTTFGSFVANSLYMSGRRGLRQDLAEFLGSKEAAETVFQALPDRVRGGLYFTNPITGQQIARATYGGGDLFGPVGDWANKMRLYSGAILGKGTSLISGTRGKAWQRYRQSAANAKKEGANGFGVFEFRENTIQGYVLEKSITREAKNIANRHVKEARYVIGEAAALRPTENVEGWEDVLRRAYYGQAVPDDAPATAVRLGEEVQKVIRRTFEEAKKRGVPVPDAGEGYRPLMILREASDLLALQKDVAGVTTGRVGGMGFDPTQSRNIGEVVVESAEQASDLGFDFGNDLIRLNPREANLFMYGRQLGDIAGDNKAIRDKLRKYLDELTELPATREEMVKQVGSIFGGRPVDWDRIAIRVFEEDPIKLMARYAASMARRIETQVIVDKGLRAGIISRATVDTIPTVSGEAPRFFAALRTVNERVMEAVRGNENLARLVNQTDGVLSEEDLVAVGLVEPSKMTEMIEKLEISSSLPNTEEARKQFEDMVTQWFRLSALAESGARMTDADRRLNEEIIRRMGDVTGMLDESDQVFRSLDGTYTRLLNEYGLTKEEVTELSTTVSKVLDDLDPVTKNRVNVVSRDLTVTLRAGDGSGAYSVPVSEIADDMRQFLLNDPQLSAKADEAAVAAAVNRFFGTRQIASVADDAAYQLGLEILGAGDSVYGQVALPDAMRLLRARKGVKEMLESRAKVLAQPDEIKTFFNEVYDPLFQVWKAGATSLRGPGYTFLNMMGNLWHSYLDNISIKVHKESAKILLDIRAAYDDVSKEIVEQGGRRLSRLDSRAVLGREADKKLAAQYSEKYAHDKSIFEIFEFFVEDGGMDSAQLKEALNTAGATASLTPEQLRRGRFSVGEYDETRRARVVRGVADSFLNNKFSGAINSLNTDVETWTRFAAYLQTFAETGSRDSAIDRVFLLHFNYGDLSNWDQALRRIFPFYVWSRNNIPAQVRALFMQPGKIRRLMAAQENLKGQLLANEEDSWLQEVLPDYIGEVEGFASRMKSGPYNVALASSLPFDDVDRIFQLGGSFGIRPNTREITQMFGPQVIFPLEMAFQRDFSTGGAFDPLGREATGWRTPLGYLPGIGSVGPRGERRISEAVDKTISDLLPPISTAERALTGTAEALRLVGAPEGLAAAVESPAPSFARERGLSNLLNVTGVAPLFGFSSTTLAPRTISSTLRERRARQLADINEAAGRAGVSVAWVRERLDEGMSTEQVLQLIARGEGKIDDYEAALARRSQGPSERTQGILGRLME